MGISMRRWGTGAAVGLILMTAACGGDSEDTGTTLAGDGALTTTTVVADAGPDGFCDDVVAVRDSIFNLQTESGDDIELFAANFTAARDEMAALEVHPDIEDDWATMTHFMTEMTAVFAGLDFDDPAAAAQQFSEQSAPVQDLAAEAEAASGRIDTFITDHCGIELDGPPGG